MRDSNSRTSDLQSAPFVHSGNLAFACLSRLSVFLGNFHFPLSFKSSECFRRLVMIYPSVLSYLYSFQNVLGWLPNHRKVTLKLLAFISQWIPKNHSHYRVVRKTGFEPVSYLNDEIRPYKVWILNLK